MAKSQNQKNIAELAALCMAGKAVSVTHGGPWIGGTRADFFRIGDGSGFCEYIETINNKFAITVVKCSKFIIDRADAVEFDPYNNLTQMMQYIGLADELLHETEDQ